jgi:hypothetical protein
MALQDPLQATVSVWSREDNRRPHRNDDGRDLLPRRDEELQRKYDRVNPDVPRDMEHEPDREDR